MKTEEIIYTLRLIKLMVHASRQRALDEAIALLQTNKCPKCEEWQKAWDEMIRNLGERKAHYAKQKNCAQAVCVLAAATNSMKALDPRRKSEPKKPKFVCPACGWSGDKAGDSIIFTSYDYCPECSHRLSKRPNKPFDWEMGV